MNSLPQIEIYLENKEFRSVVSGFIEKLFSLLISPQHHRVDFGIWARTTGSLHICVGNNPDLSCPKLPFTALNSQSQQFTPSLTLPPGHTNVWMTFNSENVILGSLNTPPQETENS